MNYDIDNIDNEESLHLLVNSNLQDLMVPLQILYPSNNNNKSNDNVDDECSCCTLTNIDEFNKRLNNNNEISFHDDDDDDDKIIGIKDDLKKSPLFTNTLLNNNDLLHEDQKIFEFDPINIKNNTFDEEEPELINVEDLTEWIDDSNISTPYEEDIEDIEFLKDNIDILTEWMIDDSNNSAPHTKDIEVVEFSKNNDEEGSSTNRISTEPIIEPIPIFSYDSQKTLKDDNNVMKEDPPHAFNQRKENMYTTTDDNLVYPINNNIEVDDDDTTRVSQMNIKQRLQEEEDSYSETITSTSVTSSFPKSSLQDQQQEKLSSSLSKISNLGSYNYQTENNKSIVRKIQESKKRLEVLRLQNTFILNSDLFSYNNRKRSRSPQIAKSFFEPYIGINIVV